MVTVIVNDSVEVNLNNINIAFVDVLGAVTLTDVEVFNLLLQGMKDNLDICKVQNENVQVLVNFGVIVVVVLRIINSKIEEYSR